MNLFDHLIGIKPHILQHTILKVKQAKFYLLESIPLKVKVRLQHGVLVGHSTMETVFLYFIAEGDQLF